MSRVRETHGLNRAVSIGVQVGLIAAVFFVLVSVYQFSQTRFLSIDEFQWGHATWLVADGQVPYLDFYEHHLPLGYTSHALLYNANAGFVENTLQFRKIAFGYVLAALAALAWASWKTHRSGPEVWLTLAVVPAIGFGLMSAIDYRGDNWAAFTLLTCLALVEVGQKNRSRSLAIVAGGLLIVAIGMTQKILLLGGGALGLLWIGGLLQHGPAARIRVGTFRIDRPFAFAGGALLVGLIFLGVGALFGLLESAWQINVLEAIEHENLYPSFSASQYIQPYWEETRFSSALLIAGALVYMTGGRRHFWSLPLGVAAGGLLFVRAPFPYNFVLISWLIGVSAVRAWCEGVRWMTRRHEATGRSSAWLPLLYGVPLLLLPAQLGFVWGTSTLDDQLRLLSQVERHTEPNDVVIDSAGSALFRPHRGYYWYHGRAHIQMFAPWFKGPLVDAMRSSQAPLWIRSARFNLLPEEAARYLLTHYVPLDGDLYVLGFTTRATGPEESRTGRIEIVRPGPYHVTALAEPDERSPTEAAPTLQLDGQPVTPGTITLQGGWHEVSLPPNSPAFRFSILAPEAFGEALQDRPHTPLFEYRRARRPSPRVAP
ncbi:MAG: hypothetical protein CBC48_20180 [bacterium TMED88]|nr:hypothetical protein [Deltaproteobacteria bacterium]OUV21645.1 MAG: hypothetical protein CBC48_20180 [bacterium TMED88]